MTDTKRSAAAIEGWCVDHIARTLDIPAAEIDTKQEVERLGLDSAALVVLIVELEEWLGTELTPQLLFEYPTIAQLAQHIAAQRQGGAAASQVKTP